jgi:hypothetical protein
MRLKLPYLLILILTFSTNIYGTELFKSNKVLELVLTYNIEKFRKDKLNLRESGPKGVLTLPNQKKLNVQILSRGKGSLDNENPPYKLKFVKSETSNTIFSGIKKIKAFTTYNNGSNGANHTLMSNYLSYKLLELYAPYAFKTRLFRVKYIDTSNSIRPFTALTFFIEPNKVFAKRTATTYTEFSPTDPTTRQRIEGYDVKNHIHIKSMEKVTAFQFFSGNFDFAIPGLYSDLVKGILYGEKNSKMFLNQNGNFIPIAFDFDFSPFIDNGLCDWERAMKLQSSIPDTTCNLVNLKKQLQISLGNFHYHNNVMKQYPAFKKAILKWKKQYKEELSSALFRQYLNNLNDYIKTLDSLLL